MSTLGIYDGHNAGAALIASNGRVVAAVEEERFSRIKNHDSRPKHDAPPLESVAYCAAATKEPITRVAYGIQHPDELSRLALENFDARLAAGEGQRLSRADELGLSVDALRNLPHDSQAERARTLQAVAATVGLSHLPTTFVDHHTAHAGGAYLLSGAARALVLTLDGKGDDLSGSVSIGQGGALKRVLALPTEDSLGHLYSAFTVACGLRPQRDEGKLQAMAAAGRVIPRLDDWLEGTFHLDPLTGAIRGRLSDGLVIGPYPDRPAELQNEVVRGQIGGFSPVDVAATVQAFLERIVTGFARWHLERADVRSLVVSGGVFANVSLNRRLGDLKSLDQLHVHPAMTDAGIALGAAAVAASEDGASLRPLTDAELGPDYPTSEIAQAFIAAGYRVEDPSGPAEHILATALARGEVVARFVGRAEYGPRALGNRSILAPATDPGMPARLNGMLRRSSVMPFAPIARRQDSAALFSIAPTLESPVRYMTVAVPCQRETRRDYPAIVHRDGTARPQLVDEGPLSELLGELERLSGQRVLINTSFNLHDEPMVCRPSDAARTARTAGIATVQVGRLIARWPA